LGIPAEYKPVNDVIVETRKISGTGAAEIGDCIVFVGNLILDFDYETMSKILKVPDEKFRDKVHKTLRENLSTIRRELGEKEAARWDEAMLNGLMAEEFQKLLGPMDMGHRDETLQRKMDAVQARMDNEAWLFKKGRTALRGRDVKIRAGTKVLHRMHKASGGLIRADFEVTDGKFGQVHLSGDFFCFPEEAITWLESGLQGLPTGEVKPFLEAFYPGKRVETPGIQVCDWIKVLAVEDPP
jgi:lipoate-protein ligase A